MKKNILNKNNIILFTTTFLCLSFFINNTYASNGNLIVNFEDVKGTKKESNQGSGASTYKPQNAIFPNVSFSTLEDGNFNIKMEGNEIVVYKNNEKIETFSTDSKFIDKNNNFEYNNDKKASIDYRYNKELNKYDVCYTNEDGTEYLLKNNDDGSYNSFVTTRTEENGKEITQQKASHFKKNKNTNNYELNKSQNKTLTIDNNSNEIIEKCNDNTTYYEKNADGTVGKVKRKETPISTTNYTYTEDNKLIETTEFIDGSGKKSQRKKTLALDEYGYPNINENIGIGFEIEETKDGETKVSKLYYSYKYTDAESNSNPDKKEAALKEELKNSIMQNINSGKSIADVLETKVKELQNETTLSSWLEIGSNIDLENYYDHKAAKYNAIMSLLNDLEKYENGEQRDEKQNSYYEHLLANKEILEKYIEEQLQDFMVYFEHLDLDLNDLKKVSDQDCQNWNEETGECEDIILDENLPKEQGGVGGNQPLPEGTDVGQVGDTPMTEQETGKLEENLEDLDKELENEKELEEGKELLEEELAPEKEEVPKETPEDVTDNDDEEQAALDKVIKESLDALTQNEELKYNEDTFKNLGLTTRQGETIGNSTWRYYISTDLEIVSEVTDYSTYGLTGLLNSNVDTSTDGLGTKTAYSYVYDVDGNILKDSVAKSTQTAMAIATENSMDYAFIRLVGKGNEQNYDLSGYVTITLDGNENSQNLSYKLLATGSRTKSDKESTINLNGESTSPIPDTVKIICKKLADIMYDTNKQSFVVSNAGTITIESPQEEYKVVSVKGEGHYRYFDEIFEDGFRRTWSYPEDQILIKNDGTRYAIVDVLRFDMYSISDLIKHGFICKLNGTDAKPEDASDITSKPSELEKGQESDETGKLKDNDNEHVIPEDGIDREPTFISDGTTGLDLENAYSEYIYSSNNYDYYIPEGVNENTKLLLTDEQGNNKTLTIAEALAQKYINADEFVESMGKIGVDVVKIAKTSTTPDFQISIKEEENADTTLTEIYRDNIYSYSVAGSTLPNRVVIMTADGRKLRLKYVLDHNMYTIEQLQDKGLTIYKAIINEEELAPEKEENKNNGEDKIGEGVTTTPTPTPSTPTPIEGLEQTGVKNVEFKVEKFGVHILNTNKLVTSIEDLNNLDQKDLFEKYNEEFFKTKSFYIISNKYYTGGYSTTITKVERNNNDVTIFVDSKSPSVGDMVTQAITSETLIVEMNKVDLENATIKVNITELVNGEEEKTIDFKVNKLNSYNPQNPILVTSMEEFKKLTTKQGKPIENETYTEEFFKENNLFVICEEYNKGGYSFEIEKVTKTNNKVLVHLKHNSPEPGSMTTQAIVVQTNCVEIKKANMENCTIELANKNPKMIEDGTLILHSYNGN